MNISRPAVPVTWRFVSAYVEIAVGHEAADQSQVLFALHVGERQIAAAEKAVRERQVVVGRRRRVGFVHEDGARRHHASVGQIEEARHHAVRVLLKPLERHPLVDKHQHARPRPLFDDAVEERTGTGRRLPRRARLRRQPVRGVRIVFVNQISADRRGDDVRQVREMDVIVIARLEEVPQRQDAEVTLGRKLVNPDIDAACVRRHRNNITASPAGLLRQLRFLAFLRSAPARMFGSA